MPKLHSPKKVAAYAKYLKELDAPEMLIHEFHQIVEIDNGISGEPGRSSRQLEDLDRLLFDVCRRYNFAKPFDRQGRKAYFRPSALDSSHADYTDDTASGIGEFCPDQEQSYRRGYEHGFYAAATMARTEPISELENRKRAINRWRTARIMFGPAPPGFEEEFGLGVSLRYSSDRNVPAKLRYLILQRDEFRCVACGDSARKGATLHVDHIVSIFNGGSNEAHNLQTLCEYCNLGKGKD